MEFLLVNHPLDCPICDQAGECDLQVGVASCRWVWLPVGGCGFPVGGCGFMLVCVWFPVGGCSFMYGGAASC